jgi:hypothetical protein
LRYPSRKGVAVSPYELGYAEPPAREACEDGQTAIHHGQFERASYQDEKYKVIFRNLVDHAFPMFTEEHFLLHDRFDPPTVPKPSVMIDVVEAYLAEHGIIHAIKERKTRTVYQVQSEEWQSIKSAYRSKLWVAKKREIHAPRITKHELRSLAFDTDYLTELSA